MKHKIVTRLSSLAISALGILAFLPNTALALAPEVTGNTFADGIVSTLVYSLIGIGMATIAFRVADLITPGNLNKQLTEEKNIALAIVVGAMILGICIIIAAAIAG